MLAPSYSLQAIGQTRSPTTMAGSRRYLLQQLGKCPGPGKDNQFRPALLVADPAVSVAKLTARGVVSWFNAKGLH